MPLFEVVWPKGVGYRTEPRLEAKAEDRHPAKRGDVVEGEAASGWVATAEGLYLPLEAPDGRPLLRQKPDFVPWQSNGDDLAPARPPRGPGGGQFGADVLSSPPGSSGPPTSGGAPAGELDALHSKYDKKYGRPRGSSTGAVSSGRAPAAFGPMANSHETHEAYMHEFRRGLEEMGVDTRDDPYLNTYAPTSATRRVSSAASGGSSRPGSRGTSGGSGRPRTGSALGAKSRALVVAGSDISGSSGNVMALCGAMVVTRSCGSGAGVKWKEGPSNAIVPVKEWTSVKHGREVRNTCTSGRVLDVSDRNILCMSLLGERAVLGSADHGLKEVNVRSNQVLRNLYTKRFGHSEWVTTVSHCPDGRVLSGAADSKLCLWSASGVQCVDLTGHLGSVSRVRTHAQGHLAISSSYDRTLRAWSLSSKREVACCSGHGAPILDFIWADHVVASGDRGGTVCVWDASAGSHVGTLKGHKGHITAMLALPASCGGGAADTGPGAGGTSLITTGAQDGCIRVWDLRQKLNTNTLSAHPGGAVNEIGVTMGAASPVLVSIGADGRLLMLDPRASFKPLFEHGGITEDFLYSLLVLDDIVFTGDGRGKVKCFDVRSGVHQYTLEAGENAVRCLAATESCLICAGDDGNAIIFDF